VHAIEAFAHGIEGACADVSIHHTEGAEGEKGGFSVDIVGRKVGGSLW